MGAVVHMAAPTSVDEAWERYAMLARQIADDHKLLHDRGHQESMARAHEAWRQLFLGQDVVR